MDPPFRDDLLESYSDAELIDHIISSPRASSPRVFNLSSNFIAKNHKPSEVQDAIKAIEVASRLGIRGPTVRRIAKGQLGVFTIMDRIEGSTLDVIWTKLSWFMTLKLGLQLCRFVRILRSVTSPTVGSLATGECRSFWLEDRYGLPVNSGPRELTHFIQFWANFTSMRRAIQATNQGLLPDATRRIPLSTEFVLTHHDLAPRNLLLSPSGQLWLLDWDLAGFYPHSFEYASMYNFNVPPDWSFLARLRWYLFTWIAVGYYEADARVLQSMQSKFTRFPVGRRFELLKNGGPTRRPVT